MTGPIRSQLSGRLPVRFIGLLSWQYGASLATVGIGFIYSIILAHGLGMTGFGLFALTTAIATLSGQFLGVTTKELLIRELTRLEARSGNVTALSLVSTSMALNLICAALVVMVVTAASPLLDVLLFDGRTMAAELALAALAIVGQTLLVETATGALRAGRHIQPIVLVQIAMQSIRLLLTAAALFFWHAGLTTCLAISAICTLGAAAALNAVALRPLLEESALSRPSLMSQVNVIRAHLPFLRQIYINGILSIGAKDLDVNLLGLLSTVENVAVYRVAKNFIVSLWALTDPIYLVVYPELARLSANREQKAMHHFLWRLTGTLAVVTALLMALCYIIVPLVISAFIDHAFSDAADLFHVMLLTMILWAPFCWIQSLFLASGRPELGTRASFLHGLAAIGVYLVSIRVAGVEGAAFGYALNGALIVAVQLAIAWRAGLLGGRTAGNG